VSTVWCFGAYVYVVFNASLYNYIFRLHITMYLLCKRYHSRLIVVFLKAISVY